jgi:two-component system LytT family sensor kinase
MARRRFSEDPDRRLRLGTSEVFVIAAFWTSLGVITAAGRRLDPRVPVPDPEFTNAFVTLTVIEYAVWAILTGPIIWLASRYSVEGGIRVARIALFIVLGLIVAASVDYVLSIVRGLLFPFIRTPRLDGGGWRVTYFEFFDDFLVYLAILGAGIARDYFLRYRIRVEETIQLQAQLAQAELSALRSQLNPHFLFNTLHAISSLVERDPRGVRKMIARLSDLLRASLDGNHEQEVPLEKELETLQRYIEIMEIRYQGRLTVETSVEEELNAAMVPTLILQPIVENAMKHGVDETRGDARISIEARREGGQVILRVTDSGPGPGTSVAPSNGVGLPNTKARLQQLYGHEGQLTLRSGANGGTVAEIRVPFHTAA